MENMEIYILTYNKKVEEKYDSNIYKPLVCGANNLTETYGYLCDNTKDNISNLNKYYSELTGEYWAWKNSNADIMGFCHYRRWYIKNFRLDKLTKEDILENLKEYDIIMPHRLIYSKTLYDFQKELDIKSPEYDIEYEDYFNVESVLKKFSPEYLESYREVMNGHFMFSNNMFICNRELADKYFEWLFPLLKVLEDEIDFSKYDSRDSRVFGFLGERLLTTFVVKNDLKIKEYDMYCTDYKFPFMYILSCRSSLIQDIMYKTARTINRIQKKFNR